jgi:signal transduction histidine kinase
VGRHFGLGLSLVKRIVTAMGGTVQAQSEIGGVFSIWLQFPVGDTVSSDRSHVLANVL